MKFVFQIRFKLCHDLSKVIWQYSNFIYILVMYNLSICINKIVRAKHPDTQLMFILCTLYEYSSIILKSKFVQVRVQFGCIVYWVKILYSVYRREASPNILSCLICSLSNAIRRPPTAAARLTSCGRSISHVSYDKVQYMYQVQY